MKNVWTFIGVPRQVNSESEGLLTSLYEKFFEATGNLSGLDYKAFSDVEALINAANKPGGQYNYFWEWLSEFGLPKLRTIADKGLPNNEQSLDVLDYRIFILEEDIRNNIPENLVASLADAIGEIYNFTQTIEEIGAVMHVDTGFQVFACTKILPWYADLSKILSQFDKESPLEISGLSYCYLASTNRFPYAWVFK